MAYVTGLSLRPLRWRRRAIHVVATRKCRINCNETLSPPYRLSNGRYSGAAGEVVDARHRGFWFLHGGDGRRAAVGVFFERQGQSAQQNVAAINAQGAIELMGEFHGFSGVAAMAGQGRQREGVGAQRGGCASGHDALIAQAEAAGQIEATGQGAKVARGVGGGAGEALVLVGAEAIEHDVGLLQSGGTGEAEFADQTVLKSAPGAFDAALSLR